MAPWLIVQPFAGWMADRYNRRKIILFSITFFPVFMSLWPSMNSYSNLLFLRIIISSVRAFMMPASEAYLMDFTEESRRGLASGISSLGARLGSTVIGTTILGHLYEKYGLAVPFYIAALFILPSIPILLLLKKRETQEDKIKQ
jgi:MFS family permease